MKHWLESSQFLKLHKVNKRFLSISPNNLTEEKN